MSNPIIIPPDYNYDFESISDFEWCVKCGGEVEFVWNDRSYSITHPNGIIDIGEGYYLKDGVAYNVQNHKECVDMIGKQFKTTDEVLEYNIDGVRLRDIVTKIKVTWRFI